MIETTHISPCYAYRGQQQDETEFEYGQRVANELETEIQRLGVEDVVLIHPHLTADNVVTSRGIAHERDAVDEEQTYYRACGDQCDVAARMCNKPRGEN